jgi:hypothetical protein
MTPSGQFPLTRYRSHSATGTAHDGVLLRQVLLRQNLSRPDNWATDFPLIVDGVGLINRFIPTASSIKAILNIVVVAVGICVLQTG